jgi:BASS family bile acid:Na+ symporter
LAFVDQVIVFEWISRLLAPLTLVVAISAYLSPGTFLFLEDYFLWPFAATMFALGIVLKPGEFVEVLRRPRAILLGLGTQFTVMPLLGFSAAYAGGLEPAVALGFVIVACAPGAMASNVIVYLAGGAVAYSVALTTFATFLSPLVTPSLVQLLGGVFLPIPFWPMMRTIILTVVVPLLVGMMVRSWLRRRRALVVQVAPAIAVISIVLIIGYVVAANQARMIGMGWKIFLLVVLLNAAGYAMGWSLATVYRFDRRYQVTLMIEVGMQNAGLGVVLALSHFSAETALPGAFFATWCILTAAAATTLLRWKK